ncbi:hypothetical protein C8Q78DRAFT_1078682 [Trametes maxima]|nr:hypothetical protein C8Q78DRAFT_1078682 [Trametes maxima]
MFSKLAFLSLRSRRAGRGQSPNRIDLADYTDPGRSPSPSGWTWCDSMRVWLPNDLAISSSILFNASLPCTRRDTTPSSPPSSPTPICTGSTRLGIKDRAIARDWTWRPSVERPNPAEASLAPTSSKTTKRHTSRPRRPWIPQRAARVIKVQGLKASSTQVLKAPVEELRARWIKEDLKSPAPKIREGVQYRIVNVIVKELRARWIKTGVKSPVPKTWEEVQYEVCVVISPLVVEHFSLDIFRHESTTSRSFARKTRDKTEDANTNTTPGTRTDFLFILPPLDPSQTRFQAVIQTDQPQVINFKELRARWIKMGLKSPAPKLREEITSSTSCAQWIKRDLKPPAPNTREEARVIDFKELRAQDEDKTEDFNTHDTPRIPTNLPFIFF